MEDVMKKLSHRFYASLAATLAIAGIGFLDIAPAHAGSASADLTVSASVSPNCTIATAPVSFGAYDAISANAAQPLDGSGSVTVQCTSGASASIMLGQGSNADAGSSDDSPLRRMKSAAGEHLAYSLFADSSRSVIWGNSGASAVSHTGSGLATQLSVFGRIPAGQNVPGGSYSDTVLATVNF
jgi:spore coat protein U-like protein